jgi:hypothetical protein
MSGMKNAIAVLLLILTAVPAAPLRAGAQAGSVEIITRVTPSSGVEEPVRGFPLFLLTKSYEDISKEAQALYPKPDMNAFIDKLDVSKDLKAWMKKNHTIRLNGEEFVNKLEVNDIMGIHEFFEAYVERMSGDQTVPFPQPKFKPNEKIKDPAKYDRLVNEYHDAIRRFLTDHPKSTAGMDLNLEDIDPTNKWDQVQGKSLPEIHRQTLALAQSKYLAARAQTDLQGQAAVRGVAPGSYWLSSLDVSASVGDSHPRWDVPISVSSGHATNVLLSNANAVPPPNAAP